MKSPQQHITAEEQVVWSLLESVNDPEIPVLTVVDLGIVRNINIVKPEENVEIFITPTYSGCPAMDAIRMNIRVTLLSHGYTYVRIEEVLSPAWTTAWMTEEGKHKLRRYGIAPPGKGRATNELFGKAAQVSCPLCGSAETHMLSEFGSTSCKALYQCNDCKEPFDVFKCH